MCPVLGEFHLEKGLWDFSAQPGPSGEGNARECKRNGRTKKQRAPFCRAATPTIVIKIQTSKSKAWNILNANILSAKDL